MKNTKNLHAALAAAAEAAKQALQRIRPEHENFIQVLCQFESAVRASNVEVPDNASATIKDATNTFRKRYDALRDTLDSLVEQTSGKLTEAYEDIARDSDFVTIMLFGRTRAGKSTTMEALTGGNGASIGVGRQHTTTDIRAYYFPRPVNGCIPDGPALRIVDTPGIEGFQGEALAEMAEEFVERSDHILFLLTDDKATADELDRFGVIKTQGKGITVLLNVKASDEDLDLLVSRPELIFRPDEIDGHSRRICSYLERHFEMPPPRLIPVHARAAWLGRYEGELPGGIEDRELLVRNSRLQDVEDRISEFIQNEALPARLCAPRDLLLSYLWPLKDELRPFAGEFRQMMRDIDLLIRSLESGSEKARARVASRFPLLRARFQATSDAVPGLVDSVIVTGGRGEALNKHWRQLLETHGVTDATTWFIAAGKQDFETELSEKFRAATFDYELSNAEDLDDLLGEYHNADNSAKREKYARAGIRAGGGIGAAALTTWAIANWWNPTGWAAAAAAVLVAGAGMAGEEIARKATDEWERSSKKDMYEKRGEIIKKLRDRLWADFYCVRSGCGDWLDKTKAIHLNIAHEVAKPIQQSARHLWRSTVECLGQLDKVIDSVNFGLVTDVLLVNVPEYVEGLIKIDAIARLEGYRTKVVVSSVHEGRTNALAACIGRQGTRIRAIRATLGNERIDLVDGRASKALQVLQALGQTKLNATSVLINEKEGETIARVRVGSLSQVRSVIGPKGANIQLAKHLLGFNIIVEEINK